MKNLNITNIHVRYDEMVYLLQKVSGKHPLNSFDKIIFLGDYIAYGKQNEEVIELILKMKEKLPNFIAIHGAWETVSMALADEKSVSEENLYRSIGLVKDTRSLPLFEKLLVTKTLFNQ